MSCCIYLLHFSGIRIFGRYLSRGLLVCLVFQRLHVQVNPKHVFGFKQSGWV